jgi:hypothetical protein
LYDGDKDALTHLRDPGGAFAQMFIASPGPPRGWATWALAILAMARRNTDERAFILLDV